MEAKNNTRSKYSDARDGGHKGEAGADKSSGWTTDEQVAWLLGTICESGSVSDFKSLVKANPCVFEDAAVRGVNTPLHVAARRGHLDLIKEIINLRPALAERFNLDGLTPVHLAVESEQVTTVLELLSRNLGLYRVRDCHGRTPLHYGAARGKDKVVQALIEFSLSNLEDDGLEEVTHRGETPLHLAAKNNHKGVYHILKQRLEKPYGDANIEEDLQIKISHRTNRIMSLLTDKAGNTVIQLDKTHKQPIQSSLWDCLWDKLTSYNLILFASILVAVSYMVANGPSIWSWTIFCSCFICAKFTSLCAGLRKLFTVLKDGLHRTNGHTSHYSGLIRRSGSRDF